MAKDKKKKKKKKKEKKKKKGDTEYSTSTSSKAYGKTGVSGITIGNAIDRSKDNLFIGTDYREVFSWQYERTWPEILTDLSSWHYMPFSLGLELELILAYNDGSYPDGAEMVHIMKESIRDAIKIMDQILYEGRSDFPPVPQYIVQKVLARPYFREDKEKGGVMVIRYKLPDGQAQDYVDVDSFARDGNATAVT